MPGLFQKPAGLEAGRNPALPPTAGAPDARGGEGGSQGGSGRRAQAGLRRSAPWGGYRGNSAGACAPAKDWSRQHGTVAAVAPPGWPLPGSRAGPGRMLREPPGGRRDGSVDFPYESIAADAFREQRQEGLCGAWARGMMSLQVCATRLGLMAYGKSRHSKGGCPRSGHSRWTAVGSRSRSAHIAIRNLLRNKGPPPRPRLASCLLFPMSRVGWAYDRLTRVA
jgi:hypothetical protein